MKLESHYRSWWRPVTTCSWASSWPIPRPSIPVTTHRECSKIKSSFTVQEQDHSQLWLWDRFRQSQKLVLRWKPRRDRKCLRLQQQKIRIILVVNTKILKRYRKGSCTESGVKSSDLLNKFEDEPVYDLIDGKFDPDESISEPMKVFVASISQTKESG
jgi:hypothetical protein